MLTREAIAIQRLRKGAIAIINAAVVIAICGIIQVQDIQHLCIQCNVTKSVWGGIQLGESKRGLPQEFRCVEIGK